MRRRTVLGLLWQVPAALLLPGAAVAIGPRSRVRLAQLVYSGGNPQPRPTALRRLAWEVEKRTSIDVALDPVQVRLGERDLYDYPFLYMGGDRAFDPLSDEEARRLRTYLVQGGSLLIDSADARPGGEFDQSVRRMVKTVFPNKPLKRIRDTHTIFKSFYLLEHPVGRVVTVPYLEGVTVDGRTLLIYVQNDLAGAWARDNFGQWEYSVYPGGDRQRELAIRWGVNLLMYVLCLDYKSDQVHIPFVLKRRQWRVP